MRVLIINSVCGFGSTGKIVVDLAKEFIENGDECVIAYGRQKALNEYSKISYRIGNDISVRINGTKARLLDNEGFNAKRETKKFLKWAEDYNPDLVWLHNLHGYYINVELLFNWLKSRPNTKVKWTLHDCWAFTGHCSYFTYVGCDKWKTQCKNCPQLNRYPKSLRDNSKNNYVEKKRIFTQLDNISIITPSHWLENLVKESFLSKYNVEVIYNKIDTNIFKPTPSNFREKYNLQNKKIILGVANKWDERKGLNDFIELSKLLDENCKIVLVGLSKKQIKQLPKNCVGITRTNNQRELAEIYTTSDLFFNPSKEENLPTVLLEAKCCKTRIVTYNVGDAASIITEDDYLVEYADLKEIVNILSK